jgi:hypothetical protein
MPGFLLVHASRRRAAWSSGIPQRSGVIGGMTTDHKGPHLLDPVVGIRFDRAPDSEFIVYRPDDHVRLPLCVPGRGLARANSMARPFLDL